jgi:hypothetical protein
MRPINFLLAIVIILSLVTVVNAAEPARIMFVKGAPRIMKIDTADWQACAVNMPVDNGDRIKTGQDESIDIAVGKKNLVRVEPNSDVFIKKTSSPYSIELLNGAAMASIKALPRGSKFEIRTPTGVSGARGTAWRAETDGKRSTFGSFEKSIYVRGLDKAGNEMAGELTVKSGWKASVDMFERPGAPERMSRAELQRWNEWKSSVRDSASRRGTSAPMDKMDRMGNIADSNIDNVESRQDDIQQTQDQKRIEDRNDSPPSNKGSGGHGPAY